MCCHLSCLMRGWLIFSKTAGLVLHRAKKIATKTSFFPSNTEVSCGFSRPFWECSSLVTAGLSKDKEPPLHRAVKRVLVRAAGPFLKARNHQSIEQNLWLEMRIWVKMVKDDQNREESTHGFPDSEHLELSSHGRSRIARRYQGCANSIWWAAVSDMAALKAYGGFHKWGYFRADGRKSYWHGWFRGTPILRNLHISISMYLSLSIHTYIYIYR